MPTMRDARRLLDAEDLACALEGVRLSAPARRGGKGEAAALQAGRVAKLERERRRRRLKALAGATARRWLPLRAAREVFEALDLDRPESRHALPPGLLSPAEELRVLTRVRRLLADAGVEAAGELTCRDGAFEWRRRDEWAPGRLELSCGPPDSSPAPSSAAAAAPCAPASPPERPRRNRTAPTGRAPSSGRTRAGSS
jgi:hypothetical protein